MKRNASKGGAKTGTSIEIKNTIVREKKGDYKEIEDKKYKGRK